MAAAVFRRSALGLSLLITIAIGSLSTPVRAQGTAFACPEPASPAASPAAAASPSADVAFPEGGGELTVFAAASLTDAFAQMAADLEAAHDGLAITSNFGGSQALVTQLAEGAAADVFASANAAQMQAAVDNGNIAGEPAPFVHNRLVIVTPAGNPAGIDSPDDLGAPGLLLVLAQPEVPAGRYAREAVCLMGQDAAAYGEDFVDRVAANLVSEEEDVRAVLAKVQLGEADAGIVYVSDAAAAGDAVRRVEIPDDVNVVATYPIAVVEGGDQALAEAFIAYALGPEGQATLGEFGFEPIG